jgi:type 1 glutamine amidotransferase
LIFSRITRSIVYSAFFSTALLSQAPQPSPAQGQAPQAQPGAGRGRGGAQVDPWAGKKRLLIIADPQEWYGAQNYHHQAASHAMATMERIGRESGVYVSMIRTDMRLLTKGQIAGANVKTLDYFDAIFYMGEGPWNITDQQKADLLSFVHDDGKGFFAAHAGNGGSLILWPEYADMIGGNLTAEFSTLDMPIIVEDPKFPGMDAFPREFKFKDQFTIVGPKEGKGATARAAPNYSRDKLRVIMRLDASKLDLASPSYARLAPQFRADNDFPIVWAKSYGKGRVFYSSFGHEDDTMDDPRIQKMYLGAIKWLMGMADADVTPRPLDPR